MLQELLTTEETPLYLALSSGEELHASLRYIKVPESITDLFDVNAIQKEIFFYKSILDLNEALNKDFKSKTFKGIRKQNGSSDIIYELKIPEELRKYFKSPHIRIQKGIERESFANPDSPQELEFELNEVWT